MGLSMPPLHPWILPPACERPLRSLLPQTQTTKQDTSQDPMLLPFTPKASRKLLSVNVGVVCWGAGRLPCTSQALEGRAEGPLPGGEGGPSSMVARRSQGHCLTPGSAPGWLRFEQ